MGHRMCYPLARDCSYLFTLVRECIPELGFHCSQPFTVRLVRGEMRLQDTVEAAVEWHCVCWLRAIRIGPAGGAEQVIGIVAGAGCEQVVPMSRPRRVALAIDDLDPRRVELFGHQIAEATLVGPATRREIISTGTVLAG